LLADGPEGKPESPKAPPEKPQKPKDQPQVEQPKAPEGSIAISDSVYFKLIGSGVQKLKWTKRGSSKVVEMPEDVLIVKFSVTNSGKGTLVYISAHSRLEEKHKGRDEKNNAYKQLGTAGVAKETGYFPEGASPEAVIRLEPGKTIEDAIVFEKPKQEAEKVILTLETEPLLLADYGYIEIEVPVLLGKTDPTKQPTAQFTKKTLEKTELTVKGEARIANSIVARLVCAQLKPVSALDKEYNVVITTKGDFLVLKLSFENKTSKNISYTAFLAPEFGAHVVARDDLGKRYMMLGIKGCDLCEAKSGLPSGIKPKETITDLLILEPPQAGAKSLTVIAVTDLLFPGADKFAGLLLAKIPLSNGKVDREKNSYIKFIHQELALEQKVIIDVIDESSTLDKTKWDDKYCGIRVSGTGKVFNVYHDEEGNYTQVIIRIGESSLKQVTYAVEIVVPGSLALQANDEIQYKGVIWGVKSEEGVCALGIFGISIKK
jgi:hypothetical protein